MNFKTNPIFQRNLKIALFLLLFMFLVILFFTSNINQSQELESISGFSTSRMIYIDRSGIPITEEKRLELDILDFINNYLRNFEGGINLICVILCLVVVAFSTFNFIEIKKTGTGFFINSLPIKKGDYFINIMVIGIGIIVLSCLLTLFLGIKSMDSSFARLEGEKFFQYIDKDILFNYILSSFLYIGAIFSVALFAQVLMTNPLVGIIFALCSALIPFIVTIGIIAFFEAASKTQFYRYESISMYLLYQNYISKDFYPHLSYGEGATYLTNNISYYAIIFAGISSGIIVLLNVLSYNLFKKCKLFSRDLFEFELLKKIFMVVFPILVGFIAMLFWQHSELLKDIDLFLRVIMLFSLATLFSRFLVVRNIDKIKI